MKLNKTSRKFALKPISTLISLLLAAPTAWAAAYPTVPLALSGGQSSVKSNVLLFIDTSGSMRNPIGSNSNEIRQVEARKAAKQVIADNRNLRFGLATFNDSETRAHPYPYIYGANIRVSVQDADDDIHFNRLNTAIDNLTFSGGTPTTSAYYELTRYFRGMSGAYPDAGGANGAISYESPIQYRCQKNAIVFISDGQPQTSPWNLVSSGGVNYERTYSANYSNNSNRNFYVPNPTRPLGAAYDETGPFGHASTNLPLVDSPRTQVTSNGSTVYSCTQDNTCTMYNELGLSLFARIAHNEDMMKGGSDLENQSFDDPKFEKQTIETYTIGFGENIPLLSHAATAGGGSYYTATSAAQLQAALKNIFQSIPSLGEADFSAVAPTVARGENNAITSAQALSLNTENWSSQLRFYSVGANNVISATNYTTATYAPAASVAVISTDTGVQALTDNASLNNTTFGLPTTAPATQWQKLVQWLTRREADANTGYRVRTPDEDRYLGDVLGSSLTTLGLADKTGYGYGASNQEFLAVGSNDGMAHIYRKTGAADDAYTDVFQYIPGLAQNQNNQTINERLQLTAAEGYGAQSPGTHQNLVNGPISWHETYASNDRTRVYMTGTLGEGGRAAYALNIAGVDADNNAVGLDGGGWVNNVPLWDTSSSQIGAAKNGVDGIIGHTFGEPFNGRISLDGSTAAKTAQYHSDLRYATILGSGFDPALSSDNATYPAPSVFVLDSLGVNAGADSDGQFLNPEVSSNRGALLRQISVAGLADNIDTATAKGMTSPTGLDIDGDGLWDVAYAGDQNGNVYRFDFRAEQSKWNAEIIFKGSSSQPITAQPNVYRSTTNGRVTVLFGTGSELYSSDLTDTSLQRFYGIQDPLTDDSEVGGDLGTAFAGYPITPGSTSLLERTYTQSSSGDGATRTLSNGSSAFNQTSHRGWYIDLTNNGTQEGERVVTMPEVGGTKRRGGSVLFTTRIFKPGEGNGKTSCTAPSATSTSGFLMTVNAETGGRAPGLRFLQDNQDMIGVYYGGSLSSPKLAGNNTYDQTVFGGSRSGRAFRLNSNPEIPSGCTNDAIQVGVGSSQDGAALRAMYCPSDLSVRRISWREIF